LNSHRARGIVARMFEEILAEFTSSPQAQGALEALQKQGISPDEARDLLAKSLPGAANSFTRQTEGHPQPHIGLFNIFGGHAGRDFLAGVIAGIARGDGFIGSIEDGGLGILIGHLTEYLADEAGIDGEKAGIAAAAVAPFIAHFVHDHLARHQS
jgi:hypothetical protein